VLKPGGQLAVVTFHSVEDRMVKRFLTARAGAGGNANRFAPDVAQEAPAFTLKTRKAIMADAAEVAANPRARSAKLRLAMRTDAPPGAVDAKTLRMPKVNEGT
jgi:16S rRNA (cytosine1402-N4)-methyltransferase